MQNVRYCLAENTLLNKLFLNLYNYLGMVHKLGVLMKPGQKRIKVGKWKLRRSHTDEGISKCVCLICL